MFRTAFAIIALFLLGAPAPEPAEIAADGFDMAPAPVADGEGAAGSPLVVMTYNVEGVPWPAKRDRTAELAAIGARLAAMRARGDAPHVVVLQEAFSDEARRIAALSGYRHVVEGPAAGDAAMPSAQAPLADRSMWRGEDLGAWMPSGLVLLSDYPVLASWRAAFPRTACAGSDCLANKGVLLARIAVPGAGAVDVVTTHVNSRRAARAAPAYADAAFARQMAVIAQFVRQHADPRLPLILAGDLNLHSADARIASLTAARTGWAAARDQGGIVSICARRAGPCHLGFGFAAIEQGMRNNDWQIYTAGRDAVIRPVEARLRFQPDSAGRALSDHEALLVGYRVLPRRRGA